MDCYNPLHKQIHLSQYASLKINKSNAECGIICPTNAIYMGSNSLLGSKALSKCEVNPTSGFQDIAFISNKLLWRPSWFS